MRPLRLLLDGFGSYRQTAEADFSDVDFFAVLGPTGSGKSTLIDGLCFALYGTVPRWGKENVIAQALAPAANACRVCLVFEASGTRYGAIRALARDKKGRVHTKEARLELLDAQVPADAPIGDILEASIDQIAEGPDVVKSEVEKILGLTYEHFTQSVLLPQGRFSEFLQAKASDRQDLLVELLAFGVYNTVGQKARERAKLAAERARVASSSREELREATEEAETRAAARVRDLTDLAQAVEEMVQSFVELGERANQAAQQASESRAAAGLLAAVQTPAEVPGLARRITEADQLVAERRTQRNVAEKAEIAAQQSRDALPDKARTDMLRNAYIDQRRWRSQLHQQEQDLAAKQEHQQAKAEELEAAERERRQAHDDQRKAERSHDAIALAQGLTVGEDCPVCLQPVASIPHHRAPADLTKAQRTVDSAEKQFQKSQTAHGKAATATAAAQNAVETTRAQLDEVSATLADAPGEADIAATADAIVKADETLRQAQQHARAARDAFSAAEQKRSSLSAEEQRAWAQLSRSRDSIVQLGAPATDTADLAAAWTTLTSWAGAQHDENSKRQPDLDAAAAALQQHVTDAEGTIARLLAGQGISDSADPARAAATVATHRERAQNHLSAVRQNREKAARLDKQIRAHREEEQVASLLGQLLRADSFEGWLCGEALDFLVAEASHTLMELSAGQYQLGRDSRNNLFVIDYQDAGAERPVHTLSGGETFQASLALALALSRQVIELSAGKRDLNSMFLDEGFGTLDEDTLETVATTLERLATNSDRMVGVITHVQALAERVPVRFIVSRAGATSTLRKERVA